MATLLARASPRSSVRCNFSYFPKKKKGWLGAEVKFPLEHREHRRSTATFSQRAPQTEPLAIVNVAKGFAMSPLEKHTIGPVARLGYKTVLVHKPSAQELLFGGGVLETRREHQDRLVMLNAPLEGGK